MYDRSEQHALPVHHTKRRRYVVGKPGNEIRVRNHTGAEVLAVISVDGVDAITGETANWNQTGYVISPYLSTGIRDWCKSLSRIATFVPDPY